MIYKSRGIVLHRINYSDTSLIAKIYTEQGGMGSFLLQGARKKTSQLKANLLQPLSIVELVAYHKETTGLQKVKELKCDQPLHAMHSDITKTGIALFLSEVLLKSIREENPNPSLFKFLYESILHLEGLQNPASFHHLFLIKLSKYLGFYPQQATDHSKKYFDLQEGIFVSGPPPHPHYLNEELSASFNRLIRLNFDQMEFFSPGGINKKILLNKIIEFYRLHIAGFGEIKSLAVLETVMK